jgi:hypothetical protein
MFNYSRQALIRGGDEMKWIRFASHEFRLIIPIDDSHIKQDGSSSGYTASYSFDYSLGHRQF